MAIPVRRCRPVLDIAPRAAGNLVPAQFLLVAAALFLEIDAHEARGELREEPCGADHAHQVGDRERDGNPVGHRHALGFRQIEFGDRVARCANRRRLGQRSGDHTGGRARVVTEQFADHVGRDEPGRRDDDREQRLVQAVTLQAAEELRAGPEADRKQEQQEETLLDLARHVNAQLPDDDAGQQRAGDGAERETSEFQLADDIADAEYQEERDLGMGAKRRDQPRDHGRLPGSSAAPFAEAPPASCEARKAIT